MDLLGGGLDSLLGGGGMEPAGGGASGGDLFSATGGGSAAGLGEIFSLGAVTAGSYVPPQEVSGNLKPGSVRGCLFAACPLFTCSFLQIWLSAQKGKGLEISGTFNRKNNQPFMELTFTNRAMQQMSGFAIQFNKNR